MSIFNLLFSVFSSLSKSITDFQYVHQETSAVVLEIKTVTVR